MDKNTCFRTFLKNGIILLVIRHVEDKSLEVVLKTRPGHFNVHPKTRTGTDPKISNPEPDQKFTSTFWIYIFLSERTKTKKELARTRPEDPNVQTY